MSWGLIRQFRVGEKSLQNCVSYCCFLLLIIWFYNIMLCRWVLLEVVDKVSPGSVNWKHASKPPIKMPFKKVENCNQVVRIGKQLKFSLVNVAGNDIVQGNKKLILGNHILSHWNFDVPKHKISFPYSFILLLLFDNILLRCIQLSCGS